MTSHMFLGPLALETYCVLGPYCLKRIKVDSTVKIFVSSTSKQLSMSYRHSLTKTLTERKKARARAEEEKKAKEEESAVDRHVIRLDQDDDDDSFVSKSDVMSASSSDSVNLFKYSDSEDEPEEESEPKKVDIEVIDLVGDEDTAVVTPLKMKTSVTSKAANSNVTSSRSYQKKKLPRSLRLQLLP